MSRTSFRPTPALARKVTGPNLKSSDMAGLFHERLSTDHLAIDRNAAARPDQDDLAGNDRLREDFDGLPVPSPDGKMLAWTSSRAGGEAGQLFLAQWNHENALEAIRNAPLRKASKQ